MAQLQNWPANTGDTSDAVLVPGSGRFPGAGNDNLLQYSCLKTPMDRGAWQINQATVHGVAKVRLTEHANMYFFKIMLLHT